MKKEYTVRLKKIEVKEYVIEADSFQTAMREIEETLPLAHKTATKESYYELDTITKGRPNDIRAKPKPIRESKVFSIGGTILAHREFL
jgi:hypothetical protein